MRAQAAAPSCQLLIKLCILEEVSQSQQIQAWGGENIFEVFFVQTGIIEAVQRYLQEVCKFVPTTNLIAVNCFSKIRAVGHSQMV